MIDKQRQDIKTLETENSDLKKSNNNAISENEELRNQIIDICNKSNQLLNEKDDLINSQQETIDTQQNTINAQNIYLLLEKKKDNQIRKLEKKITETEQKLNNERNANVTQNTLLSIISKINNNENINPETIDDVQMRIIYQTLNKIYNNRNLSLSEVINEVNSENALNLTDQVKKEFIDYIEHYNLIRLLGTSTKPLEDKIAESQNKINELVDDIESKNQMIENDRKEKEKFSQKIEETKARIQRLEKQKQLTEEQLKLKDKQIIEEQKQNKKLIRSIDLKQEQLDRERRLTAIQKKEFHIYKAKAETTDNQQKTEINTMKNEINVLNNDIAKEKKKQEEVIKILTNAQNLEEEIKGIEEKYNQLVSDYKTLKIKEEDFKLKQKTLLLNISSLEEKNTISDDILNALDPNRVRIEPGEEQRVFPGIRRGHNVINIIRQEQNNAEQPSEATITAYRQQYTQIERLQGLKDKIEVGVVLPSIERQKEATINIIRKEDPLLNIKKESEQIIAIKLTPVDFHYLDKPQHLTSAHFFEAIATNNKQYIKSFYSRFPLTWQWSVSNYMMADRQIMTINNNNPLLDINKRNIFYDQISEMEKIANIDGSDLLGNNYLKVMLYNSYMKTGVNIALHDQYNDFGSVSIKPGVMLTVPHITPAPYPINLNQSYVIFKLDGHFVKFRSTNQNTKIINGVTDWIPIVFDSVVP